MKTTIKLFVLALTISLASCSKSNDTNPSNSNNNSNNIGNGSWVVTYYLDSGKNETSDYSGYTFNFNANNVLEAVNSASTFTGTWYIGDRSGDDNSSSNRFVINITGNNRMDNLQHDWVIVKITDTEISLKDDNASSGEELKFGR